MNGREEIIKQQPALHRKHCSILSWAEGGYGRDLGADGGGKTNSKMNTDEIVCLHYGHKRGEDRRLENSS